MNGNWTGGKDTTYPYYLCLVNLVLDTCLYMFLAWYLDNVLPSEYGIKRKWNFLCQRCFVARRDGWGRLEENDGDIELGVRDEMVPEEKKQEPPLASQNAFEAEPEGLNKAIVISGLGKIFDKQKCCQTCRKVEDEEIVALKDVSLNLYEGQVLSLLGHNGAGKSTLISILCGLFHSTTGTVMMNGEELENATSGVRQNLGVCPQHDILFDLLTVREHLLFYGKCSTVTG